MAHFYSVLIKNKLNQWQKIKEIKFPALVLIVSGGHTNLYLFKNWSEKRLLSSTLDDAAGETLDKCARFLGLPYPGGPWIEKLAQKGKNYFALPKPMLQRGYQFSFSGLKTAFIDLVSDLKKYKDIDENLKADLCFSLQKTLFEILIYKLKKAKENFLTQTIVVSGGVAANQTLKKMVKKNFPKDQVYFPEKILATDNGLNIAFAGYFILKFENRILEPEKLEVYAR